MHHSIEISKFFRHFFCNFFEAVRQRARNQPINIFDLYESARIVIFAAEQPADKTP